MKLIPHCAVQRACTGKSSDAAQLQRGIKRCKIAQLHRHAVRASSEFFRKRYNHRLSCVKLPKGEFVIEV